MSEKEIISDHINQGLPFIEAGGIVKMKFESDTKVFFLYMSRALFKYMYEKLEVYPAGISIIEDSDEEEREKAQVMIS